MERLDDRLTELPLRELLERLAAGTPAPGGGSAAAITCAVAAALAEMASALSSSPTAASDRRHAGELRERALELAELDLESYAPVLHALRRPAEDPERPAAVAAALSQASVAPMEVARVAGEVAALAARVTQEAGRHLLGDAATATVLAEAACAAAALLVEINLARFEDERPGQAAQCVRDASTARRRAYAKAHERR
ncbi:MAG: cyclodeaminase/cyclohydrolase family protein [Solirubrobacteraceae bacterium]